MNTIDPIEFGKRLKQVLKAQNITQTDVAKNIGISKTSVNNYVQGRIPDATILYQLALQCNTSMEWLLSGIESNSVYKSSIDPNLATNLSHPLSEEEEYLIKLIRKLPIRERIKIEGVVEEKLRNLQSKSYLEPPLNLI